MLSFYKGFNGVSVQKMPDELSLSAVASAPLSESIHLPLGCEGRVWHHAGPSLLSCPHRHAELEANLATRGTASYLVGDARIDLKPGTLLWLFPTQDHILLSKSPDFEMWIAVWTPQLTDQWCQADGMAFALAQSDAPLRFHSRLAEADKRHLEAVFVEVARAASDPARCNAGLAYLLLSLWDAHQRAEKSDHTPVPRPIHPAVEKTARLMRDETEPLSVAAIAQRVGLSASRLSHLFRTQTGQSIAEFRNRQRIERFLRLYNTPAAIAGGRPVTLLEAALDAGFGSYAQFFRVFRAVVGCAPADYFK